MYDPISLKYDNSIIEGVIGKLSPMGIISTKDVFYKSDEIELKPLHVIRSDKLNDLGIWWDFTY